MTLRPGEQALVSVAVSTLWRSPDVVRPEADAPALRTPVETRAWVDGLGQDDRSGDTDRVLTQLLLGERVIVEEVSGDWAKVIATQQPSSLDDRGYPGWVHASHLTQEAVGEGVDLVVEATATALRDAPFGDILMPGVSIGTRLVGTELTYRGWTQVLVPGQPEPAWVRTADVAEAPDGSATAEHVLELAERLLDVPYVWGGLSPYGLDCSGLVHLACRRYGIQIPRDAHDQAEACKELSADEAAPGDLYFFARPGKKIHHVGFVAGERRMLHACSHAGRVVLEPLEGERAETLVGAKRLLTA